MAVNLHKLKERVAEGERFTCLTAYDSTFADLVSGNGTDMILVGDSLGMVVQGKDSTLPVSMDEMCYHTAAVAAGNQGALIMADMPFMSYQDEATALINAGKLMQSGANLVKLEGGAWLADTVAQLRRNGVPSCVHMGLTPQSVNVFGGFRVQGRQRDAAERMIADAHTIAEAGADILLLECVPSALAKRIVEEVNLPVIGIGAGPATQGQVLVSYDMLGLGSHRKPKFVKDFMAESATPAEAIQKFVSDVKTGTFPAAEHEFS